MHDDPRIKLSDRYSSLCKMFVKIACRVAKSEETYSMSTNCAEKLAEDIENFLKIRGDPDLDSSPSPQVAKGNQIMASKPKGIELKRKEICGSARPIGGLEKSSQNGKKKKNDDSPAEVVELQPVTEMQPQPYATVLVYCSHNLSPKFYALGFHD
jgi:zinc finger SWIM domain-containing protein 3